MPPKQKPVVRGPKPLGCSVASCGCERAPKGVELCVWNIPLRGERALTTLGLCISSRMDGATYVKPCQSSSINLNYNIALCFWSEWFRLNRLISQAPSLNYFGKVKHFPFCKLVFNLNESFDESVTGMFVYLEYHVGALAESRIVRWVNRSLFGETSVKLRHIIGTCLISSNGSIKQKRWE